MNTNDARIVARARANRRLRRMTIGTAVLGVAATGALGWTAAMSYDGSTATTASTTAIVTGAAGSATASSPSTTTPAATSATTSAATAAPIVTSVTGNAHAATGGS